MYSFLSIIFISGSHYFKCIRPNNVFLLQTSAVIDLTDDVHNGSSTGVDDTLRTTAGLGDEDVEGNRHGDEEEGFQESLMDAVKSQVADQVYNSQIQLKVLFKLFTAEVHRSFLFHKRKKQCSAMILKLQILSRLPYN